MPDRYGLYLTIGKTLDGRPLAIISDGQPQLGHTEITVCAVKEGLSRKQANQWFKQMERERPWETRQ